MPPLTTNQLAKRSGIRLPAIAPPAEPFADVLRRAVNATITDERLRKILEVQLKAAEGGDAKAAKFVIDLCGGQGPSTVNQTVHYHVYGKKSRTGPPKTPLALRMRSYLRKHGAKKPAVLAVDLDATEEEIQQILQETDWFRLGLKGVEAA